MHGRKLYDSKSTRDELGPDFFPEGSERVYGLGKMPDQIVKIMRLPVWQAVMARFLKLVPQKSGYMLASTAALRLVPGARPQPLHRGSHALNSQCPRVLCRTKSPTKPAMIPTTLFTSMLGCLIAGSRCTYNNGATAVIPEATYGAEGARLKLKSAHTPKWNPDRPSSRSHVSFQTKSPIYEARPAKSNHFPYIATYHGAGENKCDKTDPDALRTLFAVFGQRDYFRQDQEEFLSTPIEIARKLPEDILLLAGYNKPVGGVCYVADHQSPLEFLHQDNTGIGKFVSAAATQAAVRGRPLCVFVEKFGLLVVRCRKRECSEDLDHREWKLRNDKRAYSP
ncbi:hypothetical protein AJ79_08312 [Helicocarpus griseus UAMH5409]|uniref:Uncharacterized protein n=1 Tax=Helicocarpus griseus UAMH5409 TaxID=1447875 RepID=A0A2B7WU46_9EURO|nr:hypothetical protein AJ79_08312 [Helicocarpus griseus UAMH5409]